MSPCLSTGIRTTESPPGIAHNTSSPRSSGPFWLLALFLSSCFRLEKTQTEAIYIYINPSTHSKLQKMFLSKKGSCTNVSGNNCSLLCEPSSFKSQRWRVMGLMAVPCFKPHLLLSALCRPSGAERGHADERLHRLAHPGHTQGHQPPDPQGEDPHDGALHEGGEGQVAHSRGPLRPGRAHPAPVAKVPQSCPAALALRPARQRRQQIEQSGTAGYYRLQLRIARVARGRWY